MRSHKVFIAGVVALGCLCLFATTAWAAATEVSVAVGHHLYDCQEKLFKSGIVAASHSDNALVKEIKKDWVDVKPSILPHGSERIRLRWVEYD